MKKRVLSDTGLDRPRLNHPTKALDRNGGLPSVLPGPRVVAHVYHHMQPQIPQGVSYQVARDEKNIVSHVSALARHRQDDDVFTRHVSDAGHDGAWDVHRPHGPESLQFHPMWSHDGG